MTDARRSFRMTLRERRRQISPRQAAENAARAGKHLLASPSWAAAERIGLYLPQDGEMPVDEIVRAARQASKTLYLPAIRNQTMEFRCWSEGIALVENRFGILEPGADAPRGDQLDLALVPLVGWAWGGYRLGMGGGYFDRFLAARRPALCLGLAFESQREDRLSALREPWDQDLDGVVTEAGLVVF